MRWFETQIRLHTVFEGAFALLLLTPAVVYATLPVVTEIKHFRDFRGPSHIQVATGDQVEIGANSVVPSEGTTGQAVQDGVTLELRRDQRCTKPDEISRSRAYDANLVGAWMLTFTHAGTSTDPIDTHAIGSAELIPLAEDLAVVGLGTRTPTLSWSTPVGAAPDEVQIRIFDRGNLTPEGRPDQILRAGISGDSTSYDVPLQLCEGQSLRPGGRYTFSVGLAMVRPGDGSTLTRSRAFMDRSRCRRVRRRLRSF